MTLPRSNGRIVSPQAYAFHARIDRAIAAAGLRDGLKPDTEPIVVLGPGEQVEILFEMDPERAGGWTELTLIPSEAEPPRWRASLRNTRTGAVAPPPDDAAEHDTLDGALAVIARAIRAQADGTAEPPEVPS